MTASNYVGPPLGTAEDSYSGGGLDEKKEQAQQVAGTAKDEGGRVASVAKDEALNVAGEAKQQAANLLDQALREVEEQSATQRDRLVDTLRTFSDDVEKMLSGQGGGDGLAADLARQVAERARSVTQSLQGRQPGELLEDVRGFARRRPTTFLVGALAAGVVAGRLARGAKDSGAIGGSSGTGAHRSGAPRPEVAPTPAGGTAAGHPTSGVTAAPGTLPPSDPAQTPLAPDAGIATDPGTAPTAPTAPPPDGPLGGASGAPYGGSPL